jgi:hypothetical protein
VRLETVATEIGGVLDELREIAHAAVPVHLDVDVAAGGGT